MSPVFLNYLAALQGFAPPPLKAGFTYCELGCDNDLTINTLAVAYPQGDFWPVAINPDLMSQTYQWATECELTNIHFIESRLTELEKSHFPFFDFITLHGVYSRVSPEKRRHIIEFIQQKLLPGGLIMLSYDAMPGSAMIQPIRDMILTACTSGDTHSQIEPGIAYLRYLYEHQAAYFTDNPQAQQIVEQILEGDLDSFEFLNNAHWTPFYFTEIAQTMANAGLTFVGSLPLYSNYLEVATPLVFHEFLKTVPDRLEFETHKCFICNEDFRSEVYIKTTIAPVAETERLPLFDGFYFGTEKNTVQESITFQNKREICLDYTKEPSKSIVKCLQAGSKTLTELVVCEPKLAEFTGEELLDTINMLVLSGEFSVFAAPSQIVEAISPGEKFTIPNVFNHRLLEQCHFSDDTMVYLASPIVGDGVAVDLIDALLLLGLVKTHVDDVARWVWDRVDAVDKKLEIQEELVESQEEQIDWLNEQLDTLLTQKIGKFIELGFITQST
jgi:hypothetical protein